MTRNGTEKCRGTVVLLAVFGDGPNSHQIEVTLKPGGAEPQTFVAVGPPRTEPHVFAVMGALLSAAYSSGRPATVTAVQDDPKSTPRIIEVVLSET